MSAGRPSTEEVLAAVGVARERHAEFTLSDEQRAEMVALLTTHHHVTAHGKKPCAYCENYYGGIVDTIAPVVARIVTGGES